MTEIADTLEAGALATLEGRSAAAKAPNELLAIATEIDELGRQIALQMSQHAARPELIAPLRATLLRVPIAYTTTLLRAAEKFDDVGSPRRAAHVLVEALRRSFDANMVPTVAEGLVFLLEAHAQMDAAAHVRAIVMDQTEGTRRERRIRFHAAVDQAHGLIDWRGLDDELGTD